MFDEPINFEESFDDDLRGALSLSESDQREVWPKVQAGLPDRFSLWDTLAPFATAAAVLAVAWSLTTPSGKVAWPVNDTVKDVPMAHSGTPSQLR